MVTARRLPASLFGCDFPTDPRDRSCHDRAQVAGAKPPLRLPAWLGRLLAGQFVVAQMTTSRGFSNQKARKELGWVPQYPSWREGFRAWVRG